MAQEQSHCVFSKTQKQPQCTCQAKTVAGSSLIPHVDLLVHPSGTIWTVMDACESRPGYLQPCHWCVWIVLECMWLSCQAIKWISVLLGLCRVLPNPVTYALSESTGKSSNKIKTHNSESQGQEEACLRDEQVSYLHVAPL